MRGLARAAPDADHSTVIVCGGVVFGLLMLVLHLAHRANAAVVAETPPSPGD